MLKGKRNVIPSVGMDVGDQNCCNCSLEFSWYNHFRKCLAVFTKSGQMHTVYLSNPYLQKCVCSPKDNYYHVQGGTVGISSKLQSIQVLINRKKG